MNAFLVSWVIVAVLVSFIALAAVVGLEIRDYRATSRPTPIRTARVPAQRTPPSAAVIVHALDTEAFDEFLGELIVTPHVEEVLR